MSTERALYKNKLTGLEHDKKGLEVRIRAFCDSIRQALNPVLTPVADMEIPATGRLMDDLETSWGDLQAVMLEIERTKRALGD